MTTPAHSTSIKLLQQIAQRSHVLLTGRGAAGIWAFLRVCGFKQRIVLIPANTCYLVLWAVIESGNYPLLVDIDPATGSINQEALSLYDDCKAAVVIPCHMYGIPAPIAEICEWARRHEALVLEDACLAIGNNADERPCGMWGDASIFSFGMGKIIDVELGGAFLTDDARLCSEVSKLLQRSPSWNRTLCRRQSAWNDIYWAWHRHEQAQPELLNLYPALFEMYRSLICFQIPSDYWNDLPAALSNLEKNRARRLMIAESYDRYFRELGISSFPKQRLGNSALWRFSFFVAPDKREEVLESLSEVSPCALTTWYPSLQSMASKLAPLVKQRPTPHADTWGNSVINLPLDNTVNEQIIAKFAVAAARIG